MRISLTDTCCAFITFNLTFTVRGTTGADDPQGSVDTSKILGQWNQVTAVYDAEAGTRTVYYNGLVDVQIDDSGTATASTHNVYIGARANSSNSGPEAFFSGKLDDIRFYNRALNQGEVLGLAGRTEPVYKSL